MVIRGDIKINSSPTSGTGDPILTRDSISGIVGAIGTIDTSTFIPTTLTNGYILVGNGSNVATGVAVTGDVLVSNTGVTSIASGVIVNTDVNASAAIALTKLAATTASRALVSDASGFITASSVTSTELGYVSGVTSSIQTQIDSKQTTITGAATTIVSSNLTVSRLLVSDGSGKVAASSVTATEAGYLSGVTSAIQTQLNAKQASIQYKDEGSNLGANGAVTVVDFVGAGVTASHSGGTVTVTISGTANGLPTGGTAGQVLIKDSGTDFDATFQNLVLADVTDVTANAAEINILDGATLTTTELNYVDGVTSSIQTQIDLKLDKELTENYLFVGNASNVAVGLPTGTSGYLLKSVGGVPTWSPDIAILTATASGTDTYTATITGVSAYTTHDVYEIIFTNANTGTSTININTLGAKSLKKDVSTDLASGDISSGQSYIIVYDGTNFQVIGIGGGSGSGTVNSGAQYRIPYYSTNPTGTVLDAAAAITASRALKSDANGVPTHFDTATEPSLTELTYVKGVTSAIQTQLNAKVNNTGNENIGGVKTFTSDPLIPDEAYGSGWNGVLEPPTKNAVYDKIESLTGLTSDQQDQLELSYIRSIYYLTNR